MSIPAGRDHPPLAPLPVFSFILPAYNELMNIERVTSRLLAMAGQLGEPFEIVWIDDGSTDGSGELLDRLATRDSCIQVLHFSRNFGHMAALTAGFEAARATGAVICLDADGQHPPELIPAMIEQWKSGAEIVQMVRQKTADETPFKRLSSGIFYSLLNRLSDLDLPEGAADFRLLDRQAVDALNSLPERDRFIRGLVRWIGFRQTLLPYDAPPRMAGATKYSTRKMLLFAFDGITSFSIRPLRIIFYLGVAVIFITLLYALYVLGLLIAGGFRVPGWTSLILLIMMLNGIQLVTLGIVSEYMGRVFNESKQRPVYVLRKCTNPHR